MSYTNASFEKKPKKRKLWIDDEHYREIPVKNKERVTDRHRNEPVTPEDLGLRDERRRIW